MTGFQRRELFVALMLLLLSVILFTILINANAEGWTENYAIPKTSSGWTKSTDNDTLFAKWDYAEGENVDWYILYVTIVDTSQDSVHWNGNYSEKIISFNVGTDSTVGSVITLRLEKGFYMCQLSAANDNGISDPSDPAWLKVEHYILVPKHFRFIVIRKTNTVGRRK